MSHYEARNKSFRVKINMKDLERALQAVTWPEGVRCRRFRSKRLKRHSSGRSTYTTTDSELNRLVDSSSIMEDSLSGFDIYQYDD